MRKRGVKMEYLELLEKDYEIVETKQSFAKCVVEKKRCVIKTTYLDVQEIFAEAQTEAIFAFSNFDFTKHLYIVCTECRKIFENKEAGVVILSRLSSVTKKYGGKIKACPKCGCLGCYLIYDPSGFADVRK